ncbi:hypothetical protein Tco_1494261 [Tanacetum coccineum]
MALALRTAFTNKNFSQKVNTVKRKFYTARPKVVNTARPNLAVVNAVRINQVNAVKASACWVWRPTKLNSGHPQKEDQGYVDSGCSRHMTRNMSYLSDFKEFDRGYFTFGGEPNEGKLLMCDKKNGVLFTDTGCFVLSPDFKLADESQVLLKVPRKNNMYSVDMNNIVPKESLTCLVAKATLDESMLWHRSLGKATQSLLNRELVVKPHNKTPCELFRGRTPALSFMRPFGKAFRVYNIRTRKVEESLHIRFLEDKPIIAGDGPKWLFDIDVLTKSNNYGTSLLQYKTSNDLCWYNERIGADGSLFDSSSKNASNDEPQPSSDAGKKDDKCVNKESRLDDQEKPENSTQDVNYAGPSINNASTDVNTGSLNINTVSPIVTTAPHEATHADSL